MGDPLGLFAAESARKQQQPQRPDDPLGLFGDVRPAGAFSDVESGSSSAPAPRRGIGDAIGEALSGVNAVMSKDRTPSWWPKGETRRLVPPVETRSPTEMARDARAGARQQYGRVQSDATATPEATFVRSPTGAVETANEADQRVTRRKGQVRGTLQANFTPEKWREVSVAGAQYANQLHAQGRHEEAKDVERKAYNAQLLSEGAAQADTYGAIVLSNLLGIIHDPYAGQRRNIAEAAQPEMVATPEEQRRMGVDRPALPERGFEPGKDLLAPLVGQAPVMIAGGAAGRAVGTLAGAGLEAAGATRIGQALGRVSRLAPEVEALGPKVPVTSRAFLGARTAEELAEFRRVATRLAAQGATEGQIIGGVQAYRMAREQGADVETALGGAVESTLMNVPLGAAAGLALGAAGRAAGVGFDPVTRGLGELPARIRSFREVPREAVGEADRVRAQDGQLPISDQMPEAMHRKIADALDQVLNQKRTAETAESERLAERIGGVREALDRERPEQPFPADRAWWEQNAPEEPAAPLIERAGTGTEEPRLRTAAEIAMERGRPADEANAVVRMQREREMAAAARREAEQMAQEPDLRLELAAQERPGEQQGPRTLAETLADLPAQRAAEEPLATEYHDAINKYVDALAAVKDAPEEKGPSTRAQIQLARAKAALNEARQKYGRQVGASAVLALAANDDELTDEEKSLVGLGAVALGTEVVKAGEGGALAPREPVPGKFVSRLRTAIETLPGKRWDQPVPAADWIGKLKGGGAFSKAELELLMSKLEEARDAKTKLSRADVLNMADESLPRIARETLGTPERVAPLPDEEAQGMWMNVDNVDPDVHHPDVIAEQITLRENEIANTERQIESLQEGAADNLRSAEENQRRALDSIHATLRAAGLSEHAANDAIDYINEHVEGEYVPHNVVKKAMEKITDDLLEAQRDPRELLEEAGYTIHEEAEDVDVINVYDENGERVLSQARPISDAQAEATIAELREEYPNAKVLEETEEGETEYVIRDNNGNERARAADEDDAIREAVENDELGRDDLDQLFSEVSQDLSTYADRVSEWSIAESENYYRNENAEDAFSTEYEEIESFKTEIEELREKLAAADARINRGRVGQVFLGEGEAAPDEAPINEAPENPYLLPIIPRVKGKAGFASYQRIAGGSNYRELLNVYENPPLDYGEIPHSAYGGHDYWSRHGVKNVVGHVRAEDHTVIRTPEFQGERVTVPDDVLGNSVRDMADEINALRRDREHLLGEMNDLTQRYERMTEAERTANGYEIANDYETHARMLEKIGIKEDVLLKHFAQSLGYTPQEERVAVMLENQASLAQHQSQLAPPDPARFEEAKRRFDDLNRRWNEQRRATDELRNQHHEIERRYNAASRSDEVVALAPEFRRGMTEWEQAHPEASPRASYGNPPHASEILNPYWHAEWEWWEANGPPELSAAIRELREARRAWDAASRETGNLYDERSIADDEQLAARGGPGVIQSSMPFLDTQQAWTLNAGRFLIDSAERGYERIAWSDAANRVKNASLPITAATTVYDRVTPSAMKRLLAGLGFKDVKVEKLWIKGEGHWTIRLTPEMRAAIRKVGVPLLSAMALAGMPDEAEAQGTDDKSPSSTSLYASAVGGAIAGGALVALATSKRLRRLVKENRSLNRALMIDDLSGLSNKRAFQLARASVDADPATAWVALDALQFKKVNDVAGHDAGDQIIAHFGRAIMEAAREAGVPMRGFRSGGDEFAFAVPKERAAEFIDAVERRSPKTVDGVRTQLHGVAGETFGQADALLNRRKEELRIADPSLRRAAEKPPENGEDAATIAQAIADAERPKGFPLDLHANPLPIALRQLGRYPGAAALIGLGYVMGDQDNANIRRAGVPTMILGALSVIGSHRLILAKDVFGDGVARLLTKSDPGRRVVEFFNPDLLLSPAAKNALEEYRTTKAYGRSVALEHSQKAQRLGPEGNRAVSDVIEGESWEDTSNFTPEQIQDVLTVAAGIESEVRKLTEAKVQYGVLRPEQALEGYLKREYAYFDALDALADHQGGPSARTGGKTIGGATKSRVLDEPIRAAEAALADARASGNATTIVDAEQALDEAKLVQQQQRLTLGEIREAGYRAGRTFDQGWHDVAAAKLHETLRQQPGTINPEYQKALDDFLAARDLMKQAQTTADRDAAKALMDNAYVQMREVGDRFRAKDGEWRTLPDTRSYGVLRGMPVTRAIHAELTPAFNPAAWDHFLSFWKQAKTIFNVGTSIANVASNVLFSHMEGMPIYEQPVWLTKALKDMRAYGPATRHLSETGVLEASATFSPNEIRDPSAARSEEGLSELLDTTRPETAKVLEERGITRERARARRARGTAGRAAFGAAVGGALLADEQNPEDAAVGALAGGALGAVLNPKVRAFVRRGYASEDNLFRVALYLKKVHDGVTPEFAARYARQSLGDMSGPQSPATQWTRRVASPFFLYPLRAIPRFAQQTIDHPWRYVALMGAFAAIDLYSRSQVGAIDERDLQPGDRRDSFGYFLPGFTQLPMMNERGEKGAMDMARWTPLSMMTSSAPAGTTGGAISDEFPAFLQPSGPAMDIGARVAANTDAFTGQPLVKKDYPMGENIATVLNQAAEAVTPSMLAFHRKRIQEDVANNDWDKLRNDLLGPTGLRARFTRPGAQVRSATFQLDTDLREMKREFQRAMIANKNPDRVPELRQQYMARVSSAIEHFRDRLGRAPDEAIVKRAFDLTPEEP